MDIDAQEANFKRECESQMKFSGMETYELRLELIMTSSKEEKRKILFEIQKREKNILIAQKHRERMKRRLVEKGIE